VRAYVVTVAPEIAGRIVELPVADNQFVHKGDLLMKIDPTNYQIAVNLTEAAVQQAEANIQNVDSQIAVQEAQIAANQAQVDDAQAALSFASQQAARYADLAKQEVGSVQMAEQTASGLRQAQATLRNAEAARTVAQRQIASLKAQRGSAVATLAQANAELNQARANFKRVEVRSPVNGWVTNLLSQLGDYANTGQSELTLIDADSFWIDAYFTETALSYIHEGDPAEIKLMGHGATVRGRVGGVARGINIPNAQPGSQGLATVNPVFTWVRLAQRVPVRIEIEHAPAGVTLVAGLTATVQINPQPQPREPSGR
jgi:multidrug resistance efflux pump